MRPKEKRALIIGGVAAAAVASVFGIYLVTKHKATTPAATTLPAGVGGSITLTDGKQTLTTAIGTPYTLALPAGGTWVSLTSSALSGTSLLGTTPAGSATPMSLIAGTTDTLTAVWMVGGTQHTGSLTVTATVPQLTTG